MNAPVSDFAITFRSIVIPALRPKIALCGPVVACGAMTFSEAYYALLRHAHGAAMLSQPTLNQFEDWLAAQLMRETEAALAREAADVRNELV